MTSASIFGSKFKALTDVDLPAGCILFHGSSVDDRGTHVLSIDEANPAKKIKITYSYETMSLQLDDQQVDADDCTELFKSLMGSSPVVLEATTLGFAELYCAIRAIIELKINRFHIIYGEPDNYFQDTPGTDSFELSDLIVGYHPIPNAVVDLSSDSVEAGVFFLGFEPERLERALEEFQMITSKEIKVIFGVPAFKPGWELNSLIPHLYTLNDKPGFDIAYCAANDPSAAYESLEKTRLSLGSGNRMFVAPIGTKPCGIAAALFTSLHPNQVGLLYDHPQKKKNRSRGIGVWHKFTVSII